jgi:Flp pilus assembly pilin Flp
VDADLVLPAYCTSNNVESLHWRSLVVHERPRCRGSERGQALIEYAMVVALVGASLVAILGLIGRAVHRAYVQTAAAVSTGPTPGYHGGRGGGVMVIDRSSGRRPTPVTAEPPDTGEPPDSAASPEDSVATSEPQ